ncbi:LysM domain-containing protein, partial [Pleionea sp. CnH1-48]|uniref:LysM peptidoglycan-binding domain-containing protein n=1 Tax=Pleionea sp. CnH1-48 TaxID=2954494 RepID=UPI002097EAAC
TDDRDMGVVSLYGYDSAGRRVREVYDGSLRNGLHYSRETVSLYDTQNRLIRVQTKDLTTDRDVMHAEYYYDEAGNRRQTRILASKFQNTGDNRESHPLLDTSTNATLSYTAREGEATNLNVSSLFEGVDEYTLYHANWGVGTFGDVLVPANGGSNSGSGGRLEPDVSLLPEFGLGDEPTNNSGNNGYVTEQRWHFDYQALPDWVSLSVVDGALTLTVDAPADAAQHQSGESEFGVYEVRIWALDENGKHVYQTLRLQIEDNPDAVAKTSPANTTASPVQDAESSFEFKTSGTEIDNTTTVNKGGVRRGYMPWLLDWSHRDEKDYWYTYDGNNRVVVAEGELKPNNKGVTTITPTAEQGFHIRYDAIGNQVMTVRYDDNDSSTPVEAEVRRYEYNERGQLVEESHLNSDFDGDDTFSSLGIIDWSNAAIREQVYAHAEPLNAVTGLWRRASVQSYDLAGRVVMSAQYFGGEDDYSFRQFSRDLTGIRESEQRTQYDMDGRVLKVSSWGVEHNHFEAILQDANWVAGRGGNPNAMPIIDAAYEAMRLGGSEHLKEMSVSTYEREEDSQGEVIAGYDAAGRMKGYRYEKKNTAYGETYNEDLNSYTNTYRYHYRQGDDYQVRMVQGESTQSQLKPGETETLFNEAGLATHIVERYKSDALNEEQHRTLSYQGDGRAWLKQTRIYNTDEQRYVYDDDNRYNDALRYYYYSSGQEIVNVSPLGEFNLGDSASYQMLTSSSQLNESQVAVNQGDSLRSLSLRFYGTESLWYVIADANGLQGNDELAAGQTLTIPAVSNGFNDAADFKVYNPSEMIGDITPNLPYVPNPPEAECNQVAMLVMVAVAAIVTVYTAGAFAQAAGAVGQSVWGVGSSVLSGGLGFTGTTAASAFVGGVAGNLASQVTGRTFGVVDDINTNQAMVSGLTSIATVGIGSALKDAKLIKGASDATNQYLRGVSQAALSVPASVAAGKLMGAKDASFRWSDVATSVISASVNQALGGKEPRLPDTQGSAFNFKNVLTQTGRSVISAGAAHFVIKNTYQAGQWQNRQVLANA